MQNFSRQLFHDSYSLYSCCVLIQPPPHTHTHTLSPSLVSIPASISSLIILSFIFPSLSPFPIYLSLLYISLSLPPLPLFYISLFPLPLNLSHLYLPPSITPLSFSHHSLSLSLSLFRKGTLSVKDKTHRFTHEQ